MIQQSPAKTKRFLRAINKAAIEKCTDIAKQIDETTKKEMQRAENEASREGHAKIEAAKQKIKTNTKMQISQYNLQKKKDIYLKRKEYQNLVFDTAKKELIEFTKSDEYASFLEKSLAVLSDKVSNNTTIFCSADDKKYEALIKKAFPDANTEIDNAIEIGGIKVKDNDKNILIDDTLDTRLCEQNEWFISNAKMQIETE